MEPKNSESKKVTELRFLIATDIHLGHAQNHHQLGNDSYRAFEQVLSIAKQQDVDFLLLGGDLFDEVNPTQKCIFKCLNLLKDNIFGNRELNIGVKGIQPNFSNQNLNIALPIFTIHGNHDYPSNDFGKISVCDLLNASNYVNYFGKHLNLSEQGHKKIVIKPIIFQKSHLKTRLAIYGLGYIKDLKFHKMLQDKCVIFQEPEKIQQTICLFIFHQNRYKGKKGGVGPSFQNSIHPQQLPKWMDLVIWCHEHEAIYKIQTMADIKIFQPGSTVITSYIEAQAWKKQCGLITIKANKQLQIRSIRLQKSYRPMFARSYALQQVIQKYSGGQKINFDNYFDKQIENIFAENAPILIDKKPIIRIKIDYTGHQIIRLIRIQQKYRQLVANSNKIFQYFQKRHPKKAFALEDNQVLDMIKNSKVPKNIIRQKQITQEIMEIFAQELAKQKIHFFDISHLKDTITDLASKQGRANSNDLKFMYAKQIQKNCGENRKNINNFHTNNDKQFKRIHQKLLKSANDNLNGRSQDIPVEDIRADISRLKHSYGQKEKQIQSILGAVHQKSMPVQSQIPISKSTNKGTSGGRSSILHKHKNSGSDSQKEASMRMSNSSQEDDDCCKRAQKQQYRENDTRTKFQKANQMVQNANKQSKSKKSVRFKNQ